MPLRKAKAKQDKAVQRELEKVRAKVKAVLGSPAASLVQLEEKLKMLEIFVSNLSCRRLANPVKYPLAQKIFDERKKICIEAGKQTAIA